MAKPVTACIIFFQYTDFLREPEKDGRKLPSFPGLLARFSFGVPRNLVDGKRALSAQRFYSLSPLLSRGEDSDQ